MDRRQFLQRLGALAGAAALGTGGLGGERFSPRRHKRPAHPSPRTHLLDGLPVADWVVEENKHAGTDPKQWVIGPSPAAGWPWPIEGFANSVSYQQGDELVLYVNTTALRFTADVLRVGYYQGNGARLVDRTGELRGRRQPLPTPKGSVNLIECTNWTPSLRLEVGKHWPPGDYLILLTASNGERHYVPFTLRDDASKAAFVVQNSVATWQAYNLYGGYSLYGGAPTGALADRSRIVSFDRPYRNPDPQGSGDFIGNELPLVYLVERHGLDVTYWTDVDLHARPHLLANHRCLLSLGHDEYWSWQMRFDGVSAALDKGLNVAFLGANACYRQVRFQPSSKGVAHRQMVCYKDAKADPIASKDPKLATGVCWAQDLVPYPESELIGSMYQSYGAIAPLVVADSSSFLLAGTGLKDGSVVHGVPGQEVVGSEFDGFEPALPGPKNVQILAHSPVQSVSGALNSDMTYYSHSGGGAVFASGTARFVQLLWDGAPAIDNALRFGHSPAMGTVTTIALNLFRAFGEGPAGKKHPSVPNWRRFYSPSAPPVQSVDVAGT